MTVPHRVCGTNLQSKNLALKYANLWSKHVKKTFDFLNKQTTCKTFFQITDSEYVGNQTCPKSLQAGRGLAFQIDKKLLCLNSTLPFWELIRGPLILVHMVRGTVTFVPGKIRHKIMMRHFYTCSFSAHQ
jgi:hypothetical protein